MPSPDDRLQELRRQRALVQEQLAFLDREIAAASGQATPAKAVVQIPQPGPAAEGDEASELMKSLEEESRSSPTKAKWGCIWIFVAAFVLFAICVVAFYLYVSLHQSPPVH